VQVTVVVELALFTVCESGELVLPFHVVPPEVAPL
jgi:hypothetical protein